MRRPSPCNIQIRPTWIRTVVAVIDQIDGVRQEVTPGSSVPWGRAVLSGSRRCSPEKHTGVRALPSTSYSTERT